MEQVRRASASPGIAPHHIATVVLGLLLAVSSHARAIERDMFGGVELKAARKFIDKSKACSVWLGWSQVVMSTPFRSLQTTVVCVFEGSERVGTIDEEKGCIVRNLRIATARYESTGPGDLPGPMAPGQRCTPKVVLKLLNLPAYGEGKWSFMDMWFLDWLAPDRAANTLSEKYNLEFGGTNKVLVSKIMKAVRSLAVQRVISSPEVLNLGCAQQQSGVAPWGLRLDCPVVAATNRAPTESSVWSPR